jgi:NAD(P)-dependent dehydrogenase (short-subunit alcohol dehydrogenase family)
VNDFGGKLAVVTGGGAGMGRELVRQLAAAGADVAMCDVSVAEMEETRALALADAPGARITTHVCDVSDEAAILGFRDAVVAEHETECIHL